MNGESKAVRFNQQSHKAGENLQIDIGRISIINAEFCTAFIATILRRAEVPDRCRMIEYMNSLHNELLTKENKDEQT